MDTVKKGSEYMQSGEVARLFGVTPRTVSRWVMAGRIPAIRTPGGRYRYRYLRSEIERIVAEHRQAGSRP